tara:strand:+ start:264 stop:497 length:234 start_codon:yes stop_codon:yes gene_type:complete
MPTIGWFEILIIVTVAILVVGPKDFPFMLKKIGSWIGSVKRYVSNVQNDVSNFENFDVDEKSANDKKTQTELDNGKE